MNEFERLKFYLTDRDGYIRHQGLIDLKNCFEPEVFPSLLRCLSDYVEINRKVAAFNLQLWSEQENFAQLCIDYFSDVVAIQHRTRRMRDIETVIFEKILSNLAYLKHVMLGQQGHLPRLILQVIQQRQWLTESELEQQCKYAKDPNIRTYWLQRVLLRNQELELKCEFTKSVFKDVQLQLLYALQAKKILDLDQLLLAWQSSYKSVMDYAYFLLRQKNFNFDQYFALDPISDLNIKQQKIRAGQWLLMKWDKTEFLKLLSLMSNTKLRDSYLILALKQTYINIFDVIQLGGLKHLSFEFELKYIERMLKACQQKVTTDELSSLLQWATAQPSLNTMLGFLDYLDYWDSLYWIICLMDDYPESEIQENSHLNHRFHDLIWRGRFLSFPPPWSAAKAMRVHSRVNLYLQDPNTKLDRADYENMLNTLKKRC